MHPLGNFQYALALAIAVSFASPDFIQPAFLPEIRLMLLAVEANEVITLCMLKIGLGGADAWDEARLMMSEKIGAGLEAGNSLIDSKGNVAAVIVGVGGFLGMGEKDVALTFDQLSFATDNNDPLVVKTNATKESLQAAPQHTKPDKRP